jgi:hypothetical protein
VSVKSGEDHLSGAAVGYVLNWHCAEYHIFELYFYE